MLKEDRDFPIKKKYKSTIVFLKNKVVRGLTSSDEFFEYIDYIVDEYIYKKNFLNSWSYRTKKVFNPDTKQVEIIPILRKEQRLTFFRSLAFIAYAHKEGSIYVNWEELYSMDMKVAYPATLSVYKTLVENFPTMAQEWDYELKKALMEEANESMDQ